jgi:hypothetical protein
VHRLRFPPPKPLRVRLTRVAEIRAAVEEIEAAKKGEGDG